MCASVSVCELCNKFASLYLRIVTQITIGSGSPCCACIRFTLEQISHRERMLLLLFIVATWSPFCRVCCSSSRHACECACARGQYRRQPSESDFQLKSDAASWQHTHNCHTDTPTRTTCHLLPAACLPQLATLARAAFEGDQI